MANMGYWFQNTADDLAECQEHMDEDDLGEDEARARLRLIAICREIAADYGGDE